MAKAAIVATPLAGLESLDTAREGLARYAAEVSKRTQEITSELPIYLAVDVTDADELATADAMLTELVRWKDASLEMRSNATGPLYKIVKQVEAWFRPLVKASDDAERHLKSKIGAFKVQLFEAQHAAQAAAVAAAQKQDTSTVVEALNASTALATASETHSTARMRWTVKRINPDLLPDEYWTPDTARIDAVAAAADGAGDAPVIPGVVFERMALVGAKR